MNQIGRDRDPDPRRVSAERLVEHDPPGQRVASYRCGCKLTLAPGEQPPDTCPGERCNGKLEGVVITDGGRVVENDHECIAETDPIQEVDRCRLCGRVIDK